jgi:hypothetical protein
MYINHLRVQVQVIGNCWDNFKNFELGTWHLPPLPHQPPPLGTSKTGGSVQSNGFEQVWPILSPFWTSNWTVSQGLVWFVLIGQVRSGSQVHNPTTASLGVPITNRKLASTHHFECDMGQPTILLNGPKCHLVRLPHVFGSQMNWKMNCWHHNSVKYYCKKQHLLYMWALSSSVYSQCSTVLSLCLPHSIITNDDMVLVIWQLQDKFVTT